MLINMCINVNQRTDSKMDNEYTITESAKLLNVSRLTIYKKIEKLKELKPHIKIKNNTKYLNDKALEIIKNSIKQPNQQNISDKKKHAVSESVQKEYLTSLKNQIAQLEKHNDLLVDQLNEKDKQLNNKDELLKNFQILLKSEQENNLKLLESNKKSIWKKIFKQKDDKT
jgi:hypothetical protein